MQIFIFFMDAVKFGKLKMFYIEFTRVLISDINFEIGGHFRSNLCFVISLRYLISSRAVIYLNGVVEEEHPFQTFQTTLKI